MWSRFVYLLNTLNKTLENVEKYWKSRNHAVVWIFTEICEVNYLCKICMHVFSWSFCRSVFQWSGWHPSLLSAVCTNLSQMCTYLLFCTVEANAAQQIRRHLFIFWIALHPQKFFRSVIGKKRHGEMYTIIFQTLVTLASGHFLINCQILVFK